MSIRRPGTAGSAVAAMAGGDGLRSSRPGLKKPRKNGNNGTGRDRGTRRSSPREKWRRGRLGVDCSRGGFELGDGGSRRPSATAVAGFLGAWRARRREQGAAGCAGEGSAAICSGRGARGGRSHDVSRGRRLRPGQARVVPSRAGGKGWRRQAGPGCQRLGKETRRRLLPGRSAGLGRAARKGEASWAGRAHRAS